MLGNSPKYKLLDKTWGRSYRTKYMSCTVTVFSVQLPFIPFMESRPIIAYCLVENIKLFFIFLMFSLFLDHLFLAQLTQCQFLHLSQTLEEALSVFR